MKTRLELELPDRFDPFDALIKLKRQEKIIRAHVMTANTILIYYNSNKITEEEIRKAIGLPTSNGDKLKKEIKTAE